MNARSSGAAETTRSGKKKKFDKWSCLLKVKAEEHALLLQEVQELENEQNSLRVRESLLLQVLDAMQALVEDAAQHAPAAAANSQPAPAAAAAAAAGGNPSSSSAAAAAAANPPGVVGGNNNSNSNNSDSNSAAAWHVVMSAVQQREHEISTMYEQLLHSLYPHDDHPRQQLQGGIPLLRAMCSADNIQKVCSMTAEQLTARLSALAGKCGLQLLRASQTQTGPAAAARLSGSLHDSYTEFSTLVMSAMIWNQPKFVAMVGTNLDTQQPFAGEPLPAEHWLNALEQLQLSPQQLQILSCLHDSHFWTGRLKLKAELDRAMQQQLEHTESLAALLQQQLEAPQQQRQEQDDDRTGAAAAAAAAAAASGIIAPPVVAGSAPGAAAVATSSSRRRPAAVVGGTSSSLLSAGAASCSQSYMGDAARDPMVQVDRLQESQSALMDEQSRLLRRWLLLGLHVGIISTCIMTTQQQAMFIVASYPSIPRLDLALTALNEHKQRVQQVQQQQQPAPEIPPIGSLGHVGSAGLSTLMPGL